MAELPQCEGAEPRSLLHCGSLCHFAILAVFQGEQGSGLQVSQEFHFNLPC